MRIGDSLRAKTRLARLGWLVGALLLAASGVTLLGGCDLFGGGGSTGSIVMGPRIPAVTATGKDMSFDIPASMPSAGLLSLTFTNSGSQPHQLNIARLNDGVTQDQVSSAFKTDPVSALPKVTFVGGVNTVDPGKSQSVVIDLAPGTYVAACFLNDVHNAQMMHAQEGMYKFFTVPQSSGASLAEPADNGLVTLSDFHIALPAPGPFTTGAMTWKVWNHGSQPHEMALIKLAQGKTEQEALAYLGEQNPAGPPPFTDAGGIGALGLDKSGWVTLNLDAGAYVALCFVPDPKSGMPHFMLGMATPFTVQ
jgi:hypothetical protein